MRRCTSRPARQKKLADVEKAFTFFIYTYEAKYFKATLKLQTDHDELPAFYDFPASHWQSLRTTNPIKSELRLSTHRTKRSKCLSRDSMLLTLYPQLRRASYSLELMRRQARQDENICLDASATFGDALSAIQWFGCEARVQQAADGYSFSTATVNSESGRILALSQQTVTVSG